MIHSLITEFVGIQYQPNLNIESFFMTSKFEMGQTSTRKDFMVCLEIDLFAQFSSDLNNLGLRINVRA